MTILSYTSDMHCTPELADEWGLLRRGSKQIAKVAKVVSPQQRHIMNTAWAMGRAVVGQWSIHFGSCGGWAVGDAADPPTTTACFLVPFAKCQSKPVGGLPPAGVPNAMCIVDVIKFCVPWGGAVGRMKWVCGGEGGWWRVVSFVWWCYLLFCPEHCAWHSDALRPTTYTVLIPAPGGCINMHIIVPLWSFFPNPTVGTLEGSHDTPIRLGSR